MNGAEHEQGLVLFMDPSWRPRFRYLLEHREKLRDRLYHAVILDLRFAPRIAKENAADTLRELGAPADCWVVCTDPDFDGTVVPLDEALERFIHSGHAALLSCIPGRLGLWAEESPDVTYLLDRTSTAAG